MKLDSENIPGRNKNQQYDTKVHGEKQGQFLDIRQAR